MATASMTKTAPRDGNAAVLQIAAKIQSFDATGTPVLSPKTSVGTTPQPFVVPDGAVDMVIRCTGTFRYGTNATLDGTSVAKTYMLGGANADTHFPCRDVATIYVAADSGTVTVYFMFQMLS